MDETLRAQLLQVSTATLCTALFKRGLRNVFLQDVHPIRADLRMCGPAMTLRAIPAREDLDHLGVFADPEHPQRKAIDTCPAGFVLVVDSRGDARAASAGDILVGRLKARGCAGIVTDGGFRDTPAIGRLGFPAYHRRPSAPTNLVHHHMVDIDVPIGCGGVAVYPGDVVVGDGEGVVVVPRAITAEVAREAIAMSRFEDWVAAQVAAGRPIRGLYPPDPATRAEYEAWQASRNG